MSEIPDRLGRLIKTGHMYRGTYMEAYESVDNCGTCDGARCDICRDIYEVEEYPDEKIIYRGPDKEKAIELAGYNFVR